MKCLLFKLVVLIIFYQFPVFAGTSGGPTSASQCSLIFSATSPAIKSRPEANNKSNSLLNNELYKQATSKLRETIKRAEVIQNKKFKSGSDQFDTNALDLMDIALGFAKQILRLHKVDFSEHIFFEIDGRATRGLDITKNNTSELGLFASKMSAQLVYAPHMLLPIQAGYMQDKNLILMSHNSISMGHSTSSEHHEFVHYESAIQLARGEDSLAQGEIKSLDDKPIWDGMSRLMSIDGVNPYLVKMSIDEMFAYGKGLHQGLNVDGEKLTFVGGDALAGQAMAGQAHYAIGGVLKRLQQETQPDIFLEFQKVPEHQDITGLVNKEHIFMWFTVNHENLSVKIPVISERVQELLSEVAMLDPKDQQSSKPAMELYKMAIMKLEKTHELSGQLRDQYESIVNSIRNTKSEDGMKNLIQKVDRLIEFIDENRKRKY